MICLTVQDSGASTPAMAVIRMRTCCRSVRSSRTMTRLSHRVTQDEQITMMSLWSIFRSPLIIGGEMTGFDDFTMGLITNEEILKMHRNARHSHPVWQKLIDGTEHILWIRCQQRGRTVCRYL